MLSGTAVFNPGGNINLASSTGVTVSGSITFVRNDLTGPLAAWTPVAQWTTSSNTTPSGFTMSVSPTLATVQPGQSSTFDLSVVPGGRLYRLHPVFLCGLSSQIDVLSFAQPPGCERDYSCARDCDGGHNCANCAAG